MPFLFFFPPPLLVSFFSIVFVLAGACSSVAAISLLGNQFFFVAHQMYMTDVSANSRFILTFKGDDPTGRKRWTRITQYFGSTGLLPIKMDKKYKTGHRDKVKKFKPWESYDLHDFVDFEEFDIDFVAERS